MKRKIAVVAVVAIMLALGIGGTIAYFTAQGTATNVITTGNVDIGLIDEIVGGTENADGSGWNLDRVMPGDSVEKHIGVVNTGSAECYVRILVESTLEHADGTITPLGDGVKVIYDTGNWISDGKYWYYIKALAPGEQAPLLVDRIEFTGAIDNTYADSTITITASAQAVQSKNNEIKKGQSVLDVLGWPEE